MNGRKSIFHEDRLIAALAKYWRPITEKEYLYSMDIPGTNNAIAVSGFPEHVVEWVWEIKRKPFEIF